MNVLRNFNQVQDFTLPIRFSNKYFCTGGIIYGENANGSNQYVTNAGIWPIDVNKVRTRDLPNVNLSPYRQTIIAIGA